MGGPRIFAGRGRDIPWVSLAAAVLLDQRPDADLARALPYRSFKMLKITPEYRSAVHVILRLEGRVVGPWVDVLRASCREALAHYDRLTLDLADVSFVDAAGVAALRELDPQRAEVTGCKGFIAQMLKEVRP